MNTSRTINELWEMLKDGIISNAYNDYAPTGDGHSPKSALQDFTASREFRELDKMLALECTHESRHRNAAPEGIRFSVSAKTSAKLLIMQNVADGATNYDAMPPATIFITYRDSAAIAVLLGYLIRDAAPPSWIHTVRDINYTKLHS